MTSKAHSERLWVWRFPDGTFDYETIRENRGSCENFVMIRYSEHENDTAERIKKRIGGKPVKIRLEVV